MNSFEIVERLYNVHLLIKQGSTGTPDEVAAKFHVCRRQIYNIRDELIDYGAAIGYSRVRQTWYYTNDFELSETPLWREYEKYFQKK